MSQPNNIHNSNNKTTKTVSNLFRRGGGDIAPMGPMMIPPRLLVSMYSTKKYWADCPIDLIFWQMEAKNFIFVIPGHFRAEPLILGQNFWLKVKNSRFWGSQIFRTDMFNLYVYMFEVNETLDVQISLLNASLKMKFMN